MPQLSAAEVAAYRRDGYLTPDLHLPDGLFSRMQAGVAQLIADNPDVRPEQLVGAHVATGGDTTSGVKGNGLLLECAHDPYLLDLVAAVLGPDLILWGSHVFCKPPRDGKEIPWHQDGQYWPIRPLASVTVWVAIDTATRENGCLRVLPGSHRGGLLEHGTIESPELALTQGLAAGQLDESGAADVILEAGQVSLHDVNIVHGSQPNRSGQRRAGWAIRYMPASSLFDRSIPPVHLTGEQVVDYSTRPIWLVRGQDRAGNDFVTGRAGA